MNLNISNTLNQGINAQNNGQFQEAVRLYQIVLSSEPNNSDAYFNLGIISLVYLKIDEALINFKNAIVNNPKIEQFWISYIQTQIKNNDLQKAKKSLKKARQKGIPKKILHKLNEQIIYKIQKPSPSEFGMNKVLFAFNSENYNDAERLSLQMLKQYPSHPFAWKILSAIFRNRGEFDKAIEAHQKNIKLDPQDYESYNNFAITLKEIGRFTEALENYQQAIKLKPDYAEAHNNLGILLKELGNLEDAEICFISAVNSKKDFVEAHNNLGLVQEKKLNFEDAEKSFLNALKINPRYIDSYNNLAFNLKEQGNLKGCINNFISAIKIDNSNLQSYYNLSLVLKEGLDFKKGNSDLEAIIIQLLKLKTIVRPIDISKTAINLLKGKEDIKKVIEFFKSKSLPKNLFETLNIISKNDLLLELMKSCPIQDLEFENIFKEIRFLILKNIDDLVEKSHIYIFCEALALQCFINEYIYNTSNEENNYIDRLKNNIEKKLAERIIPEIMELQCIASYQPLNEISWQNMLQVPKELEALFSIQIYDGEKEKELANKIKPLNEISNKISQKVKEQYEENPYPRWFSTELEYRPLSIMEFINRAELKATNEYLKNIKNPKILIAGCGTGQHSILTSSRFKNCRVTAIDISKNSLAYAKRKSEELGIKNVEYFQGDILNLKNTFSDFDIIESAGVLHHLEDPIAGWNVLNSLLKPGGIMKIGLYSKLAREHIFLNQKEIKEMKLLSIKSDIKIFRNMIINSQKEHHKKLIESPDFFSLSEVRDLLFHVQEHTFTIPMIKEVLSSLGLVFCGFENPKIKKLFKNKFSENSDIYDLNLWNELENSDNIIFSSMYQFWCQKV